MASAFAHAGAAIVLGKTLTPQKKSFRFWFYTCLLSILPDFDVVLFGFGVRYGDLWGHRGMTHSLLFALMLAILVMLVFYRKTQRKIFWVFFYFVVIASHSILDAMTNGGLGVGFFSPFDPTRYFFPFQPIEVSPISVRAFFSEWGLRVILTELIWVGLPFGGLYGLVWLLRRYRSPRSQPD